LHLPRKQKQIPFWDKNKAFSRLEKPVLFNLRDDPGETTDVASSNPEFVQRIQAEAEAVRQELGEFMQRGSAQRPTGSLFPDIPVISHEKDWGAVPASASNAIQAERARRHPNWNRKKNRGSRTSAR